MRRIKMIVFVVLALYMGIVALNDWDLIYGRYAAHSFFRQLVNENEQKSIEELQGEGIRIKGYKQLMVESDDASAVGKVALTVDENGTEKEYSLVFYFNGNIKNYGIARFEQIDPIDPHSRLIAAISSKL